VLLPDRLHTAKNKSSVSPENCAGFVVAAQCAAHRLNGRRIPVDARKHSDRIRFDCRKWATHRRAAYRAMTASRPVFPICNRMGVWTVATRINGLVVPAWNQTGTKLREH
jgi:hypothetical protein